MPISDVPTKKQIPQTQKTRVRDDSKQGLSPRNIRSSL
jgi:hypothetical protein